MKSGRREEVVEVLVEALRWWSWSKLFLCQSWQHLQEKIRRRENCLVIL